MVAAGASYWYPRSAGYGSERQIITSPLILGDRLIHFPPASDFKEKAAMSIYCPKCHEANLRRSRRRLFDAFLRAFGMIPLRCNLCDHRFYRFRRQLA